MGQVKWTTVKGQSSSKEGDVAYMVDWKGILYYELLLENQTISS